MPPKSNINWTLQGRPVKPTTLKAELIESYEDELIRTVGAVVEDLENLLDRLDRRSSNRGKGFLAVRYNHPLAGARTEVKEKRGGKTFEVFVPSDGPGTPGYVFNLLDRGRAPISKSPDGKPMTFPSYDGNLTKDAGDTSVLNRKRIQSPSVKADRPAWISTYTVNAVKPRKFYEAILQKRKFKKPLISSKKLGELGLPKVPKFKWQEGTVKLEVKRGK